MSRTNDLRSQALDLLRFPLAVVVVMMHIFPKGGTIIVRGQEFTFENYPFFMEVLHFINGFLRTQSVPIYFFISGFVFFLGVEMTKETYLRKFRNRVKSLVIPYFIWNTLAILWLIIKLCSPLHKYMNPSATFSPSLSGFLSSYWVYDGSLVVVSPESGENPMDRYPIDVPLWFVRNLIVVVACTPLLHWLIRRAGHYALWLLGILWFVAPYFRWTDDGFLASFFFFSLGAYMSINRMDMLAAFGRYFKLSAVSYVVLGSLHVWAAHCLPEWTGTIKSLNVLAGLAFAYNLAAWLLKRGICSKANPFLASASFFVYVSHGLIAGNMLKLLYIAVRPASEFSLLLVYVAAVVLTVGGLLAVFYAMSRYTPALLRVIAGRRA